MMRTIVRGLWNSGNIPVRSEQLLKVRCHATQTQDSSPITMYIEVKTTCSKDSNQKHSQWTRFYPLFKNKEF